MKGRDAAALREIVRLCDVGAVLVARGHAWFVDDPQNVPGLAAESLIIKIGENVARLSTETTAGHPDVPWSLIKRMRDRLALIMKERTTGLSGTLCWSTCRRSAAI